MDGISKTARNDVDIEIEGNRIKSVGPHVAGRAGTVEAPDLTAMPGLIENHSHRQSDFGEQQGRTFLAYGITTVRSPGGLPYEAVEDREAGDAGVRVQPRIFDTGHLMEWKRTYYKMGTAISSNAHLMRELERSHILGFDLFKSYVRMPDIQQKMIVDFAHRHRCAGGDTRGLSRRFRRHGQCRAHHGHQPPRLFHQGDLQSRL